MPYQAPTRPSDFDFQDAVSHGAAPFDGDDAPEFLEWAEMTGPEIDALDRDKTVIMLACSPLEVHGPHLPTCTDNLEADMIAKRSMQILRRLHPELTFVRLPPLYVAADVLPHVGSIAFRPSTIISVIEDLGRSLAKQGFRKVWIASFHGGPRHWVPIEVACDRVNKRFGAEMISAFGLLIAKLTGGGTDLSDVLGHLPGVTPELLAGDAHGGIIETSLMLYLLGHRVKRHYTELPQRTVDLKLLEQGKPALSEGNQRAITTLFRGFKHKLKYYEEETYAGAPHAASEELGGQMFEVLAGHTAEAFDEVLRGDRTLEQCHSPLWKLRRVFTSATVSRVFETAVRYRNRVF
jgi:creatinine amidohydrolase/Fe(II)-dependent formamide hydrolase-like protein